MCVAIDKIKVESVISIFSQIVTELWSFIDVRFFSFPLNILRTNWYNFAKVYIGI